MKLQTIRFDKKGWSVKEFPKMDSANTLILVFAAPSFIDHPEPIEALAKAYPQSKIIGCSSAGEIYDASIFDESLSVAIMQFEKTHIKISKAELDANKDSEQAGLALGKELNADDLKAIFVLSDGTNVNGTELAKGLNALNKKITVTGGLAGDGSRFKETWSIYNGKITKNCVVGVGFYGEHIQIGHASKGGWDIFGPERRITRSKGNILFELDNQPALKLYKNYLGEQADNLPASGLLFPLAIRSDLNSDKRLVRTILSVDEANSSLTFAGDIPEGYLAQLMKANFERLITAADEAGTIATSHLTAVSATEVKPVLAISISCVGRRLLLGERSEEETESVMQSLPEGAQQIGFYSYGELSPYSEDGTCDLHNQTMTITTFNE